MSDESPKIFPFDFKGMMPIMPTVITETGELDEKSRRRST